MASSEFERIAWLRAATARSLRRQSGARGAGRLLCGIGDDAALWAPPRGQTVVLTVDAQVEGIHFRRTWLTPKQIGARAVVASASDLAAMGAAPAGVLFAFTIPHKTSDAYFRRLYRGALQAAHRLKLSVFGGNLTSGPLALTVTSIGTVRARSAVRRSGARPGDGIFVTGRPGHAALGCALLQAPAPLRSRLVRGTAGAACVTRFRAPSARIAEAQYLCVRAPIHAMVDVSDGLVADLAHLFESRAPIGATLHSDRLRTLSVSTKILALSRKLGVDPMHCVLHGGENYELLLAAPIAAMERIARPFAGRFGVPLTQIGVVKAGRGITLRGATGNGEQPLTPRGFDHFRNYGSVAR